MACLLRVKYQLNVVFEFDSSMWSGLSVLRGEDITKRADRVTGIEHIKFIIVFNRGFIFMDGGIYI